MLHVAIPNDSDSDSDSDSDRTVIAHKYTYIPRALFEILQRIG